MGVNALSNPTRVLMQLTASPPRALERMSPVKAPIGPPEGGLGV
jgi:hypothetical protein